jgi:hypothetical protein
LRLLLLVTPELIFGTIDTSLEFKKSQSSKDAHCFELLPQLSRCCGERCTILDFSQQFVNLYYLCLRLTICVEDGDHALQVI